MLTPICVLFGGIGFGSKSIGGDCVKNFVERSFLARRYMRLVSRK